MAKVLYGERDYAFGQTMLVLRTTSGLTQGELADYLGVSRRTIGAWETGDSYPKTEHLKLFIELMMRQKSFPAGREAEEIRVLWKVAHQKVWLDEQWLSTLLAQQSSSFSLDAAVPKAQTRTEERAVSAPVQEPRVDWNDALDVSLFYGRERELALLTQWVVNEHCRVVSVLGMGGIGKSTLAVSMMYRVANCFDFVIFRSLRDSPSCKTLLEDCLQVLAPQLFDTGSTPLERCIGLLLDQLQAKRVLLVLDNLEVLLETGGTSGHFRAGFKEYGQFLRRVAETEHQSCLLLTSREKLAELRLLEGKSSPTRSLRLSGLDLDACKQVFAEKNIVGTSREQEQLAQIYAGNPLALRIVAESIIDLFSGKISQFLSTGMVIFGSVSELLDEQFVRLSSLEQTVLYWLAIVREPISLDELLRMLVAPPRREQILEAIDSLCRRSLVEQGRRQGSFTLQSVVLEYVVARFIMELVDEVRNQRPSCLIAYRLEQANAKEYVRQTQKRVIVAPLLAQLRSISLAYDNLESQLLALLDQMRTQVSFAQGYGPANVLTLLREQRRYLRCLDLSHLFIRDAYLQGVEMQDTSLLGSTVRDTVFTSTFDAIWAVAISGNGQYWAAASKRGEVRVWRDGGRTLHQIWQAHTDTMYALAFSPDGSTLVSGSWDWAIKLWDLKSGTLLWSSWHANGALSVAFSPDGSLLASGGNDAVVRLWNSRNGAHLQDLPHPDPILAVAWSPDGHLLASGDLKGNIRLWEIQQTRPALCIATLTGHTDRIRGLAFAPDGKILASASWDQTVGLWDVASRNLLHMLTRHKDRVNRVAWSSDGEVLASCSFDKTICLWRVKQGNCGVILHGHTAGVNSLAFLPESHDLLSGSEDGTLRLWNMASGQCMRIIQGYASSLFDIDWSPDGTQLISGGSDTLVTVWAADGGTLPRTLRGHSGVVFDVGWCPAGQWLASSAWDRSVRLWDVRTGAEARILYSPHQVDTFFYGIAWSPDGQRLASGSFRHGIHVWDLKARSQGWLGRGVPTWIRHVAWSPDGTRVVGCGDDGNVYLWDVLDDSQFQQFSGHRGVVTGVAWSPDGTRLVSSGRSRGSGELLVWDVQSGTCAQSFKEYTSVIYVVAWGSREDVIISGDSDGILRWWNVQSGKCVMSCQAHQGTIWGLRRSPDGSRLASCGDDGAVMLWNLHSGEHMRTLRRDRPYERLNITEIKGLTEEQKQVLKLLGAIDEKEEVVLQ